jgi:hypothetical protein
MTIEDYYSYLFPVNKVSLLLFLDKSLFFTLYQLLEILASL